MFPTCFADELYHVAIGILNNRLSGPVRSPLRPGHNGNAILGKNVGTSDGIVNSERHVLRATNARELTKLLSGWAGGLVLQDGVNKRFARTEPKPGEAEVRPRDLLHAEHVDVETSRCVKIRDHDRNVVELTYAKAWRRGDGTQSHSGKVSGPESVHNNAWI